MTGWRHTAKQAIGRIGRQLAAPPGSRAAVLCYHSVHPTLRFRSATPADFAAQLDWLQQDCDIVALPELLAPGGTATGQSRPRVAITFDDGYRDNYEHAFGLLQERKLPATFFITVGFVEREARVLERFQFLRQTGLADLESLSWAQAREMSAAGMELAAHTFSHPNLARQSLPEQERELIDAKHLMEDRLGRPVTGFAYPFGKLGRHFTAATIEILQRAGYAYAAGTFNRRLRAGDSRWMLPRLFVSGDSFAELQDKVLGAGDGIGWLQERTPLWLARRVSPGDFAV